MRATFFYVFGSVSRAGRLASISVSSIYLVARAHSEDAVKCTGANWAAGAQTDSSASSEDPIRYDIYNLGPNCLPAYSY